LVGELPNKRLYSRLNWETLRCPTRRLAVRPAIITMLYAYQLSEKFAPEPIGSEFAVKADHCCPHVFMALSDHSWNL
jgi:hypothetical protein